MVGTRTGYHQLVGVKEAAGLGKHVDRDGLPLGNWGQRTITWSVLTPGL